MRDKYTYNDEIESGATIGDDRFEDMDEGITNESPQLASADTLSPENIQTDQSYFMPITIETHIVEHDLYASWCEENQAPILPEDIKSILQKLTRIFGFQQDNCENIFEFLMSQLDSRLSRMSCLDSLITLHADYIGGNRSNYKKWYFVAHYELDENLMGNKIWGQLEQYKKFIKIQKTPVKLSDLEDETSLPGLDIKWILKQLKLSYNDYIAQIGLYLLIWGESNNIRFAPECICFIFKCCLDYYHYIQGKEEQMENNSIIFLDHIITPLYKFIRNQQYILRNGKWIKNRKDHESIIGYDDVNQFFWFPENLLNIKLFDKSNLLNYPAGVRILKFKEINWQTCFYKTYKEKRSWFHLLTNFSRVWIIHITMYWYYTSFNSPTLYTSNYIQLLDNQPPSQVTWTIVSLGGTLSCLLAVFATIFEFSFVPSKFPGSQNLFTKLIYLIILTIINGLPTIYILKFIPLNVYSQSGNIIGIIQFVISILTFLYLAIQSPSKYFESVIFRANPNCIKTSFFTSNFPKVPSRGKIFSIILWISVFLLKFSESYLFLTLSLRDPIRILSNLDLSRCRGDIILGQLLCKHQAKILLVLLLITDLVLFFLDTYLWYIICNCMFSIFLSFSLGISIFTPWRNIFVRLPERIYSKLIFILGCNNQTQDSASAGGNTTANNGTLSFETKANYLVLQIWNSIIISMYREHLLSLEQVNKLVYQYLDHDDFNPRSSSMFPMSDLSTKVNNVIIKSPLFFLYQDDNSFKLHDFFASGKEAERRISFFAQSLSSPIPEPIPTTAMPEFTVLVPHYSEKILLSLKEIIKEDKGSKVSVLDYLKNLNKYDWDNFVQDTKILNSKPESYINFDVDESGGQGTNHSIKEIAFQHKYDELPYKYVGFKSSTLEDTLRTRIWASLRSQTLYRTISGFMNYEKAIRILYELENTSQITKIMYPEELEGELNNFVSRKFNLLISLQEYQKFTEEEFDNAKILFEAFPNLKVSYLEQEVDPITNEMNYYSVLLNIKHLVNDDSNVNRFPAKFRIKLLGNPILGDGKSDNQNHAIIFYRGEYIQVIDANQDNYLEECLKIKSVLSEFEEYSLGLTENYIPGIWSEDDNLLHDNQVAIIGAREYIFLENIGVLGDIAAAKEQTFGTLFARTLAEIGGKLHYGHPDFLNGIFMTTRGGISKAQKGLHLNEDIYAGMMSMSRGGRIKHCDYYQCGKGRDLGFSTILNFTIKIGAGMGEQILSREHYYLGTNLPIDRFLTFYYAHAGFHINNLFISLSASLFMIVLTILGSLNNQTILCNYNPDKPITDLEEPIGCYNLVPVLNWVSRFVLSVFICFFISFLPLLFQELIEKGIIKAFLRIIYHLVSLSPFFEVFVCQIYAKSLIDNLSIGGARYISTGRGFPTVRQSMPILYSRYSMLLIYNGILFALIIIFATITMWQLSILWFYISFIAMSLSPLIFNPHQFSWDKFFIDYKELIHWFNRGNSKFHKNSWYGYQKQIRGKLLGYKNTTKFQTKEFVNYQQINKISFINRFFDLVIIPCFPCLIFFISYLFINSQTGVKEPKRSNPIFRVLILSVLPVILNALILLVTFSASCILGVILRFQKFAAIVSVANYFLSILITLINFEILYYLENWQISNTLLGIITISLIQKILMGFIYLIISKELPNDKVNYSWYSGHWFRNKLGILNITQPFREFLIKITEMINFSYDFIICHLLLFSITPILIMPFIDKCHTLMLFWSKTNKFKNPIVSKRQRTRIKWLVFRYFLLFIMIMMIFLSMILVPKICGDLVPNLRNLKVPGMVKELMGPGKQYNNDTGENAPIAIFRDKPVMTSMITIN